MSKAVKTILVIIGIIIALWIGFRIYSNYLGNGSANEKIIQLEKDNALKDEQIKTTLAEQEVLKQQVADVQLEKESLISSVNSLSNGINKLKGLQAASKQGYEVKIKDIPVDNTNIYNRCLRACAESAKLGAEFSCSRDFCTQFSSTAK